MTTDPTTRPPTLAAALAALWFGGGALAAQAPQDAPPAPAPLDALLRQLATTGAPTWQARLAALEAAAAQARQDADTLRAQAKAAADAAARETEAKQRVRAEIEKLAQLRTMLAALVFRDPATEGGRSELEAALDRLKKLPAAVWDARVKALEASADAHDRAAAQSTQQRERLDADAAAKRASADALGAERARLEQLQKLVGQLRFEVLDGAAVPAAGDGAPAMVPTPAPAAPESAAAPQAQPAPDAAPKPEPKAAPKPATKPAPKTQPMPAPSAPPANAPPKAAPPPTDGDEQLVTYVDHVFPIFEANCITCHDPEEASGGLDLSSHATALQGGGSGRTLLPGNPDQSRLYLLVSHKEKPTMPPDEPRIAAALIETIRTWIAQGGAKDLAHAKRLATERAMARAEAAAGERAPDAVRAVMPEDLPRVAKAYPVRPGAMRAVAASPGAPLCAVAGFGQVLLLHQDDLRELGVLPFAFGTVERLSFSADGTALVAAGGTSGQRGGAVLYEVRSGQELGRFGEQPDSALCAAVAPPGDLVAVGGTRRRVEVFRVDDGRTLWQHEHEDWVTAVAFSPDGRLLASADRQGFVAVREAANGREVLTPKAADGLLADVAFSPDSRLLATAGADAVCVFRVRDGNRLFRQPSADQVLSLAWRTRDRLVTGGADGRLLHWRTDGNRDPELPRVGEWIYAVAASSDGARVFAGDWQGRLTIVDAATRKVLGQHVPLLVEQ